MTMHRLLAFSDLEDRCARLRLTHSWGADSPTRPSISPVLQRMSAAQRKLTPERLTANIRSYEADINRGADAKDYCEAIADYLGASKCARGSAGKTRVGTADTTEAQSAVLISWAVYIRAWHKQTNCVDAPRRSRSVRPPQGSRVGSVTKTSTRVILSEAPGGSGRAGREVEGSPISGVSAGVARVNLRPVSRKGAHSPTAAKPPVILEILQLRSAPRRPTARSTPFRMTRGEDVMYVPHVYSRDSSNERVRWGDARNTRCLTYRSIRTSKQLLYCHEEGSEFC